MGREAGRLPLRRVMTRIIRMKLFKRNQILLRK
jgi:hypothetical protein